MERWKKGTDRQLAVIFFLLIATSAAADSCRISECEDESGPFLMRKAEVLMKTEAGEIRLFKGSPWNGSPARMHIAIVTMEPNSLMIPHYMSADLIIFLQTGEAKIGWIHKNNLVETQLKPGGILRIPAGSTFYFINTHNDRQLQMITSIEPIFPEHIPSLSAPFMVTGGLKPPPPF